MLSSIHLCRPLLPSEAPEQPESIEQILGDVSQHIMPGMTHWQSPRFFGWFRCVGGMMAPWQQTAGRVDVSSFWCAG